MVINSDTQWSERGDSGAHPDFFQSGDAGVFTEDVILYHKIKRRMEERKKKKEKKKERIDYKKDIM
jgi:hypothetical protein